MSPLTITLIILAVIAVGCIVLYFVGTRMQKKQNAQREEMLAAAQQTSMLVIDKKRMKIKDANLPKMVVDQVPKRFRNAKMPIVKVKIGPQIMNLICDESIFDELPTKGEVKAMISGIYITEIKSVRGKKKAAEQATQKKGLMAKLRKKQREYQEEFAKEEKQKQITKEQKEAKKASKAKAKKITK